MISLTWLSYSSHHGQVVAYTSCVCYSTANGWVFFDESYLTPSFAVHVFGGQNVSDFRHSKWKLYVTFCVRALHFEQSTALARGLQGSIKPAFQCSESFTAKQCQSCVSWAAIIYVDPSSASLLRKYSCESKRRSCGLKVLVGRSVSSRTLRQVLVTGQWNSKLFAALACLTVDHGIITSRSAQETWLTIPSHNSRKQYANAEAS